jgi:hypothetical protein
MKITHRAVTSSVFELAMTAELDLRFSDEDAWTIRIELFAIPRERAGFAATYGS